VGRGERGINFYRRGVKGSIVLGGERVAGVRRGEGINFIGKGAK